MKLGVRFLDVPAFLQRTPGGTDAKPKIPQSARKFRDERPELFLGLFAAEKKQQVQVRVRKEHLAAVAAQSQQRQTLRWLAAHPQQFAENFFDRPVRQLTQLPQRLAGAGSALK